MAQLIQPRPGARARPAAKEFALGARADGIAFPGRFGMEVVARLLGLRVNHPAAQDFLELKPQSATRAEAAYSAAQVLQFGQLENSWQIAQVQSLADTFALPQVNDWQRRILDGRVLEDRHAVRLGRPRATGRRSTSASARPAATTALASSGACTSSSATRTRAASLSTIVGRTTYTMSVEVPRSKRISLREAAARGRDLLRHARLALDGAADLPHGDLRRQRLAHSVLGQGVALAQLSGWYRKRSLGPRPLHEAGLE